MAKPYRTQRDDTSTGLGARILNAIDQAATTLYGAIAPHPAYALNDGEVGTNSPRSPYQTSSLPHPTVFMSKGRNTGVRNHDHAIHERPEFIKVKRGKQVIKVDPNGKKRRADEPLADYVARCASVGKSAAQQAITEWNKR
ncbi:MAG: hypothetical protein ABH864_05290 [archaeon]